MKIILPLILCWSSAWASQNPAWLEVYPAGIYQSRPYNPGARIKPTPIGKAERANPADCSAMTLENTIADSADSSKAQSQVAVVQKFFNRCEKIFSRFAPTKIGVLVRDPNYSIEGRPEISEVVFHLPFNISIHGLLAVKPDSTPRPWAIIISGTAGELSEESSRQELEAIFDESPFDVLVLPSVTGTQFIQENHILELGGVEEGRQAFEVARLLTREDSPYRHLISSLHILGVSLGGNSALLSAVYGSLNPLSPDGPKIQSVVGYCPAVDLKTAIDDLDRNDETGRDYQKVILNQIHLALAVSAPAPELKVEDYAIGTHRAVGVVQQWVLPSFLNLIQRANFLISPFNIGRLNSNNDFWDANNFLKSFDKVSIPTVLLASDDDFVVNPLHNSLALKQKLPADSPIAVFHAAKGWHCNMSQVYGEDIFATMVRGILLKNSPEFHQEVHKISLRTLIRPDDIAFDDGGEKYFGYYWTAQKNSREVDLHLKVWQPQQIIGSTFCSSWSPYNAFEGCFRETDSPISLDIFRPGEFPRGPQSDAEAEGLTRWLNSHVYVLTDDGREPVNTVSIPSDAVWKGD